MVEAKKQSALVSSFSFIHVRSPYGFGCFANSTEDKGHIGGRVGVMRCMIANFCMNVIFYISSLMLVALSINSYRRANPKSLTECRA